MSLCSFFLALCSLIIQVLLAVLPNELVYNLLLKDITVGFMESNYSECACFTFITRDFSIRIFCPSFTDFLWYFSIFLSVENLSDFFRLQRSLEAKWQKNTVINRKMSKEY